VTTEAAREAGLEAKRILTVKYLMRSLSGAPSRDEYSQPPSIEDFAAASAAVSPVALERTWTAAEIEWQCRGRVDPICVTHRTTKSFGILGGYRMRSLDAPQTPFAVIDDVLWHDLRGPERVELVHVFLRCVASRAQVVVVPLLGYADPSPFLEAGFRRSTRVLHGYLTIWNGDADLVVQGMYMDVL
jgi:hypothetical protein